MVVYLITGVSKGLGFEFVKQISEDQNNVVIGLVRNKPATEKKVAEELGERPNVHIIHGDLADYASLKQAAADTAEILGDRGIDYLVANGGYVSSFDGFPPIGDLSGQPEELNSVSDELWRTNVVGQIHLFHLFLPFVLKGNAKKVIAISTGMADLDFVNSLDVGIGALYAASKAALNLIVGKFNVQYKKDGVLFLSMSPGLVDTGNYADFTAEQLESFAGFGAKLAQYAPHFKGPITPEESVRHCRATWERASLERGDGGAFMSHFGNKQWV